jgi:excinuclease ABC subunit A
VTIEMQFLADLYLECEECRGSRYKKEAHGIHYNGKSIVDALAMTVDEALAFFKADNKITSRLQVLHDVGLGYIRLGQPGTTLSGGEAQRVKLASHLLEKSSEPSLFIFDEPTTGLHFDDIAKLLSCFRQLVRRGHSLLVVEHNTDVMKCADWIIDLGPDAGADGGRVVACGTPEHVAEVAGSYTGQFLKQVLAGLPADAADAFGTNATPVASA